MSNVGVYTFINAKLSWADNDSHLELHSPGKVLTHDTWHETWHDTQYLLQNDGIWEVNVAHIPGPIVSIENQSFIHKKLHIQGKWKEE